MKELVVGGGVHTTHATNITNAPIPENCFIKKFRRGNSRGGRGKGEERDGKKRGGMGRGGPGWKGEGIFIDADKEHIYNIS